MSDNYNDEHNGSQRSNGGYSRYSRSNGVSSYHKRRRQGRIFKIVVGTLLTAIIGATVIMFGNRFISFPSSSGTSKESASDSSVTQETTVQPAQITLAAIGDVIMNSSVIESGRKDAGGYDFSNLFDNVSSEISSYDLRLVSQETNLPGESYGFGSYTPLNAPQDLGRAEMKAGFNVVLRATDHTLDNGYEGIHNELQWWDREYHETPLLGICEPDLEANPGYNDYVSKVYVFEKDGFKVAVLNHCWGVSENDASVISALAEEKISQDVQKARELGANMIVACPHWGVENNTEPTEEETTFAQVYANNGVDVIIGTHPRVLQRVEVLQNEAGHRTVCFYSLGCFTSSLYTDNFLGGMAEVTLSRDDKGNCSVSSATLKPVVTYRANGSDYTTYLLANYTDEIAEKGWDYYMPQQASDRVAEILGDGYNAETKEYHVAL